jgi:hypothetical protein
VFDHDFSGARTPRPGSADRPIGPRSSFGTAVRDRTARACSRSDRSAKRSLGSRDGMLSGVLINDRQIHVIRVRLASFFSLVASSKLFVLTCRPSVNIERRCPVVPSQTARSSVLRRRVAFIRTVRIEGFKLLMLPWKRHQTKLRSGVVATVHALRFPAGAPATIPQRSFSSAAFPGSP